jgi:hypothetical protein
MKHFQIASDLNIKTLIKTRVLIASLILVSGCGDDDIVDKCPSPQQSRGGLSGNTQSDPDNCGKCGEVCDARELSNAGNCESICAASLEYCNGACVDLETSPVHCGDCGVECGAAEICIDGSCEPYCQTGLTECNGKCVNLLTDNRFCSNDGTCGTPCPVGTVCDRSRHCALTCQTGFTESNGECANLLTENRFCSNDGTCGTICFAVGSTNLCFITQASNGEYREDFEILVLKKTKKNV